MGFDEKLLGDGERVVRHMRTHPKALIFPAMWLILIAGLLGVGLGFMPATWNPWGTWALVAVALIALVPLVVVPFLRWNTTTYTRTWDATTNGLPATTNVDGYVRTDATHFYLSLSPTTTTVPTLGTVQDEDVLYNTNGTWSTYFNGTTHGLTTDTLDIDAFDIP